MDDETFRNNLEEIPPIVLRSGYTVRMEEDIDDFADHLVNAILGESITSGNIEESGQDEEFLEVLAGEVSDETYHILSSAPEPVKDILLLQYLQKDVSEKFDGAVESYAKDHEIEID